MDLLIRSKLERAANLLLETVQGWKRERDAPKMQLVRHLNDLSRGHVHGADREYFQEVSRRNDLPYDAQRPYIEFEDLFVRDLIKGTPSLGGFLVATEVQDSLDLLRPFSVTKRMGVEMESGLVGDQAIPKTTVAASPNGTWFATEGSAMGLSDPILSTITLTPKMVGLTIQYSRRLSLQANAEGWIRRELLGTLGTAVDRVVIAGASPNFQPIGITNTPTVQSISGTALSGASCNQMKQFSADQNAPDESITFLGTPLVRRTLENRERSAGSGFIWQGDKVSDRPAFASTDVPAGTLICGPWSTIYVGFWGRGFVLEVNPYEVTNFRAGIIQARMIVSLDVAVRQPAAFMIATSVT